MNADQIEGDWRVLRGKIREQWGRLTDEQLDVINGRLDMLAGRIQQAYGISMAEAEQQVYEWRRSLTANASAESAEPGNERAAENRRPLESSQSR
ncbi:MAG TPA: CsbD family protein [Steroidobacteraceae bacterium]